MVFFLKKRKFYFEKNEANFGLTISALGNPDFRHCGSVRISRHQASVPRLIAKFYSDCVSIAGAIARHGHYTPRKARPGSRIPDHSTICLPTGFDIANWLAGYAFRILSAASKVFGMHSADQSANEGLTPAADCACLRMQTA